MKGLAHGRSSALAVFLVFSILLTISGCTAAPGTTAASILTLASSAFTDGGRIPVRYTQQGDNVSPPLAWNATPSGTQSFALIVEDIDGPANIPIITHWIIFNIPPGTHELTEATPARDRLDSGAVQGANIRGDRGYIGPSPPVPTTHRYEFTLFALDKMLDLAPGASRADFIAAIQGHIVAVAQTMGIYQRPE